MSCFLRTRKHFEKTENREFMIENGKILVETLVVCCYGKFNPIRGFTIRELEIATNNFDARNVIKDGYAYKFYNGFVEDRTVSVMKFNDIRNDGHEDCFNNIIFASKLSSHKNVLKLTGCCLETRIPVIVFESVKNRTLADHIYQNQPHFEPLLLSQRLRIAVHIANAIAYLHIGFSRPILHRKIRPSRIFLDEGYIAKLFDFSLSVSIPEGETCVKDKVTGTMGFLAPEYINTGDYNEKCDVFSFGMLLLVLLTGQKIFDPSRGDEIGAGHYWLLHYVKKCIENNEFDEIVDPIIVIEGPRTGKEKQLQGFRELALMCVCESAEDRPTMVDVAKRLKQIYQHLA